MIYGIVYTSLQYRCLIVIVCLWNSGKAFDNNMSLGPFLRTPLTDLTGGAVNHQTQGGLCAEIELRMLDCLEAYGYLRGEKKCSSLIDDFQECTFKAKQKHRFLDMRLERHRQYFTGERSKEDHYAKPPRADGY